MFFQAGLDIIQLIDLLSNLLFFLLEHLIQKLFILTFLLLYQLLQFLEFLANQLLMDLVGLLDAAFVTFTDSQTLIDFLHFLLCFTFGLNILPINNSNSITDGANIVVFLLLHVLVHALHAHHQALLLAKEH